jgi:tRNA G10  N-methylase Trm11
MANVPIQQYHFGFTTELPIIPTPSFSKSSNIDDADGIPLRSKCVDTVITNPPFGTKNNAGMDIRLLRAATRLASRAVNSFHKTSTRDHIIPLVRDCWGYEVRVLAEMQFSLPKSYAIHKEKCVFVQVDLLRMTLDKSPKVAIETASTTAVA